MSQHNDFSDEDLTAYLDGESEHAPVAQIEEALAVDPQLKGRLAALSLDRGEVSRSFDALLSDAPLLPELPADVPAVANNIQRRGFIKMAVAASFAGLLGLGIGTQFGRPALAGWRDYVAAYHALYTRETLASIAFDDATASTALAHAGTAIGKSIDIDDLLNSPTLSYRRAQILAYNDKPILQLSFVAEDGSPFALCITRGSGNSATRVSTSTKEDLAAATWEKNGYEYILIGGRDTDLIMTEATFYAARL